MTSAIETFGLTKRYGSTTAVADLNLRIEPGQVFGFLGPNGAGKSTTIRMLMALQRPTHGSRHCCLDSMPPRTASRSIAASATCPAISNSSPG